MKAFALSYRCTLILFMLEFTYSATLWTPSTGPLPPYQPKEVGYSLLTTQYYLDVSTGSVVLDISVSAYEYLSYFYQSTFSILTNGATPVVQLAYNNYTDPYSDTATYLVEYNGRQCVSGQIEGYSPYPGYNYFQEELFSLYSAGYHVYYEYKESSYGLLLVYSSQVPYSGEYPRNMTYTVSFVNSTGYLLDYDLIGTEYCCTTNTYFSCPNSGLCDDGSLPTLTLAQTNQTSYGYTIYAVNEWPAGFFTYACPFETASTVGSSSDDNPTNKVTLALSITFGVLFGITLVAFVTLLYFYKLNSKPPMASSQA